MNGNSRRRARPESNPRDLGGTYTNKEGFFLTSLIIGQLMAKLLGRDNSINNRVNKDDDLSTH